MIRTLTKFIYLQSRSKLKGPWYFIACQHHGSLSVRTASETGGTRKIILSQHYLVCIDSDLCTVHVAIPIPFSSQSISNPPQTFLRCENYFCNVRRLVICWGNFSTPTKNLNANSHIIHTLWIMREMATHIVSLVTQCVRGRFKVHLKCKQLARAAAAESILSDPVERASSLGTAIGNCNGNI